MSTHEERLASLEKDIATLQKKTSTAIIEIEENTTIMLGVIRSQGQSIRKILESQEATDQHLVTIDQRLSQLETTLDTHTALLNEHTARFSGLETMLTQILARLPDNHE